MNAAQSFVDGKRVLVLGLGESGLSMAQWLSRHGARVRVADTRATPPGLDELRADVSEAELRLGDLEAGLLDGVDLLALSPGLPTDEPVVRQARARGIPVVGDIELFARALPETDRPKLIAITGTNGKTTVATLVAAMCRAAGHDCELAGNVSPAVLTALMAHEAAQRTPDVWVLELSSFQLESTSTLAADAATVLNVTEDHLDRHGTMADYAEAKSRIYYGGGAQIINREDRYCRGMEIPGRKRISFGLDAAPDNDDFGLVRLSGEIWLAQGTTPLLPVREMRLEGMHNAANALAALALCRAIGLPFQPLIETLKSFGGLSHRVERVAEAQGVVYYDDSKGTNVGATVAALRGFARQFVGRNARVVLIAGGEGKGQDFRPLSEAVEGITRAVILIGRDAPALRAALRDSDVPLFDAPDMTAAVRQARQCAQGGDVVLLSPACASLDMYRNYKHRGEVFRQAVREVTQ